MKKLWKIKELYDAGMLCEGMELENKHRMILKIDIIENSNDVIKLYGNFNGRTIITGIENFLGDYEIIYNPKENKMENDIEKQIKELKEKLNILETTYKESKKKDVLIPGKLYWVEIISAPYKNRIFTYIEKDQIHSDVLVFDFPSDFYNSRFSLKQISRISELEDDSISNWFSGHLKISDKNLRDLL